MLEAGLGDQIVGDLASRQPITTPAVDCENFRFGRLDDEVEIEAHYYQELPRTDERIEGF